MKKIFVSLVFVLFVSTIAFSEERKKDFEYFIGKSVTISYSDGSKRGERYGILKEVNDSGVILTSGKITYFFMYKYLVMIELKE